MGGMRSGMLVLGVMLLLLAFPGSVAADDAVLGRIGEAVQPIHSSQVRMVEEDVHIKVYPTRCEVTASFRFRNDGPGTSILVGFPEHIAPIFHLQQQHTQWKLARRRRNDYVLDDMLFPINGAGGCLG